MKDYSQRGEQKYILDTFGDKADGRLLEIGSYNGTDFSNVRVLIERGWSAVCVEPSFQPFAQLAELYKDNQRVELVNAFIGNKWGLRWFQSSPNGVATGDQQHYDKWRGADGIEFQRIHIAEVPLSALIQSHPGPFDFISIDCEGDSTYQIYWELGTNHDFCGARCVVVEKENRDIGMKSVAESCNMQLIHETCENYIFVRSTT